MKIDHVHFYLEDAKASRDWFVNQLGFEAVAGCVSNYTCTEVVKNGPVYFVLSSPLTPLSPVAQFLSQHPAGVADIAFLVEDVEAVMTRAIAHGAKVLQPIQQHQQGKSCLQWCQIAAWGSLTHTLIQQSVCALEFLSRGVLEQRSRGASAVLWFPKLRRLAWAEGFLSRGARENTDIVSPPLKSSPAQEFPSSSAPLPLCSRAISSPKLDICSFTGIDHVVLNVAAGELEGAVAWYKNTLDFYSKQTFKIQTDRSALHSQVMVSHNNGVQLAINQPASPNSQIQEFLDANRGPGIQHIALQTLNIVQSISQLRAIGLSFLPVPPSYYTQLQHRAGLTISAAELEEIAEQQILVDWEETNPDAVLLQTFTQPIFGQPTFFFELIERRFQARGFGEGNFRALFEAIEREQLKRGSIQ